MEGLLPGWIPGRKMDLLDTQWREFRSGIPLLLLFAAVQSIFANFARNYSSTAHGIVQLLSGLSYLSVLHGYRSVFILLVVVANYVVSVWFRSPWAVWAFNLFALVLVSGTGEYWEIPSLSSFSGMTNWAHHFNMVMLKQISFGIDVGRAEKAQESEESAVEGDYKSRQERSHRMKDYSFFNYMTYVFYAPLYLAGPIVSFNAWQSYMAKPSSSGLNFRGISLYALRWLGIFLLMEVFTHYVYSNGIAAQSEVTLRSKISDIGLAFAFAWSVLFFMWMKFLLIWRFFRLWSLCNQIDCPENMNRCVFYNYSMVQFWKSWHSSFNLWLLRYLYIPLGGSSSNKFINTLIVFTFVALWHDLTWRVFHWAWIVTAIFAPELIGTYLWRKSIFFKQLKLQRPLVARILKTAALMTNMLLLIACNMVGYVFGVDGLKELLYRQINLKSTLLCLCTLASAANLQLILDHYRAP
jgi:D-alanyl-lipoteichoic acid acyltransferase DltB (MBOAT superfamily)